MDETINEDDVKRCLVTYNRWQHFLADAAAQNLNGHGTWAATLLRELRHIISAVSIVTLNEFCENCESFIAQLSPDDIPDELPPISDFEKLEGALKVLSHRVSKCEVPIAFKFPLINSKTVVTLSSLSARFDKRIATASKLKELRFLMGKQNYFDTVGQVISVVQTKKSSTILRIWDGTIPQSTISTERSGVQLFRYCQENVVETLIEDKSGLLQNIPPHYCLDIDLFGRSLPMAKDLQAGDIVLVANMHLNWRKHDDYVIATLHDGEHEFKFNRGVFNIQTNHPRYFDLLGSLSNELCVANLSGLASMMESFLHDSREARERAENSISRARNSSGAIPVSITATNSNAHLLEELQADESFISLGIGETGTISGQTRKEAVQPQSVPSTSGLPDNAICDLSNDRASSGAITTSMECTQHTAQSSISSSDLFLSIEEIMQETTTEESNIPDEPRISTRLMAKYSPNPSPKAVNPATSLLAEGSKTTEGHVKNRQAAYERNAEQTSLNKTMNIPTQDRNLTMEDISEQQPIAPNTMRDPSQDPNSTIEILDDIDEGPVGGQHGESNEKEDQQSASSIALEDLELSIEQLSDSDDSFLDRPNRSERDITNLEDDLQLSVEQFVSEEDHDATLPCSQDLVLSMEETSSTFVEIIETTLKKTKRRGSQTSSSHIVSAADVNRSSIASRGRSDVTLACSRDLQLSMEELSSTSGETPESSPKRAKRRSSEAGSAHNTPATTADKDAVASRTRSHDRITRSRARTRGGKR